MNSQELSYRADLILQPLMQSHNYDALERMLHTLRPVYLATNTDLDVTNFFRCCWQDGWYFSCVVLINISRVGLYNLDISDDEFFEFYEEYWIWREMMNGPTQ